MLGIPEDAFVVGCVAAVKKHHKRIACLIREMAELETSNAELGERRGCRAVVSTAGEDDR
jgi:hypothetical protein